MNSRLIKIFRYERYIFATVLICLMLLIAELSGEKEIIFPEIAALAIGAWISEKQIWESNKRKLFLLVTLAALVGVLTVRYIPVPMIIQVLICYAFTGISLTITATNLIPIISACILPVYMQTTSWVYPIAVSVMALVIIGAQYLMEKFHIKPVNHYHPCNFDTKSQIKRWSKLLIVLMLLALVPMETRNIYFIAPPLIVTFTAFSNPSNPVRKIPLKTFAVIMIAAITGAGARLLLNVYMHLPLMIAAIAACVILFFSFEKIKTLFPPAGAILLLPLILNTKDLIFYPAQVTIGAAAVIGLCYLLFPAKLPAAGTKENLE